MRASAGVKLPKPACEGKRFKVQRYVLFEDCAFVSLFAL